MFNSAILCTVYHDLNTFIDVKKQILWCIVCHLKCEESLFYCIFNATPFERLLHQTRQKCSIITGVGITMKCGAFVF